MFVLYGQHSFVDTLYNAILQQVSLKFDVVSDSVQTNSVVLTTGDLPEPVTVWHLDLLTPEVPRQSVSQELTGAVLF